MRSLITLKALTDQETGAIVAAPTTSLPEDLGGVRNWDYRYCWLRDSVLTLDALLEGGYTEEALAFGGWALRAGAGDARSCRSCTGRRAAVLEEIELDWLPGRGLRPVQGRQCGRQAVPARRLRRGRRRCYATSMVTESIDADIWPRVRRLLEYLEKAWKKPDDGIWEVRGPRRHFVQSKVMAWLAFDCAVRLVEQFGLEAPSSVGRSPRSDP